jgi:hypothetical protein
MSSAILATQLTSSCIILTDCRGMNTVHTDAVVVTPMTCQYRSIPPRDSLRVLWAFLSGQPSSNSIFVPTV